LKHLLSYSGFVGIHTGTVFSDWLKTCCFVADKLKIFLISNFNWLAKVASDTETGVD
jgi:hypothetical protein